jgi:hypothetical protein
MVFPSIENGTAEQTTSVRSDSLHQSARMQDCCALR